MNERTVELYKQALAFAYAYNTAGPDADLATVIESLTAGKFAELIIKDCITICEDGSNTQTTSAGAAMLIKQKFEVE
jgi:hypothetical protein